MKKYMALAVLLLLSLPGCWRNKKSSCPAACSTTSTSQEFVTAEIPLADEESDSFFDEDVNEFIETDTKTAQALDIADVNEILNLVWADEESETRQQESFQTVYFDFDQHVIRPDQEVVVESNIALAKKKLEDHAQRGSALSPVTIVVEGHADHAAGDAAYNLAKSEERAKALKDRFVAAGIPETAIKTVGRGYDFPAFREGKMVEGDRVAQWPNRRNEIKLIYA